MLDSMEVANAELRQRLGITDARLLRRRRWWLRGAACVALIVAAACAHQLLQRRALRAAPRYVVSKVQRGDLQVSVSATGTLKGRNLVEVGAEVSGRVVQVLVDYNDRVVEGQLLAVLDRERLQAAMD